jgi:uncharacterized coiled-coil protein SlyX
MTFQEILNQVKNEGERNHQNYFELSMSYLLKDKLNKYAEGEYKKEIDLFSNLIVLVYLKRLQNTTDIEKTKQTLIRNLHQSYSVAEKYAIETISYMVTLLGQKIPETVLQPLQPEPQQVVATEPIVKELEKKIAEQQEDIDSIKRTVQNNGNQEEMTAKFETVTEQIKHILEKINNIANCLDSMNSRIKILEDNSNNIDMNMPKESNESLDDSSSNDKIVDGFNVWSAEPSNKLPSDFYYLCEDMRIRTIQPVIESPAKTKWISNKNGNKKYLFPNPNLLTLNTDISEFYKMDMAKLGKIGQNRIKITIPCEMSDKGYINYPGELELL